MKKVQWRRHILSGPTRDKRPGPKSGLEFLQPPRERFPRAPEGGGLKEKLQELRVAALGWGSLECKLEMTTGRTREAELMSTTTS